VLFLLLAVMPSALNLPQSNPTETLEYAPVPPDDQQSPPQAGNFAALGLASSSSAQETPATVPAPDGGGGPIGPGTGPVVGRSPGTKRCVGNPPRQTSDPLSPPCVSHFDGNNFGSTYRGVSADEIRVLIYLDTVPNGICDSQMPSRGPCPDPGYLDLAKPATTDERSEVTSLRVYQRYFNDRFQTYNRFVHFYAFFSEDQATASPERRRSDAVDNDKRVAPFAVVNLTISAADAYDSVMASRGIVVFRGPLNLASPGGLEAEYYQRYPRLIWSVGPSVELRARQFSTMMCNQIVNRPVSFAGDQTYLGRPRKLGLYSTSDPTWQNAISFTRMIKKATEDCGGKFEDEQHFTTVCGPCFGSGQTDAEQAVASLKANEITTLVWTGGVEDNFSKAACSLRYFPEHIFAGDGALDATPAGQIQCQESWANAMAVTGYVRADVPSEQPCYQAAREAQPDMNEDAVNQSACGVYDSLHQLFTGIQVAGPKLGPSSMDRGFHAIPPVASNNPRVPACYYEPSDYTCVKDAAPEWWDSVGRDAASKAPGCWRLIDGGQRYLAGTWPKEDFATRRRPGTDVCSAQSPTL
jgi:hypothetical protein